MSGIIRIPEERVKILRSAKEDIEKRCKVKLNINDGEIQINGDPEHVFFALDVVKAIGRGFEPKKALLLTKEDFVLHIIPLREYFNTENSIRRVKGRVIGEKGRIKLQIEEATDSYLSIYGNTIAIISKIDSIELAKEAIEMLINGAKHSTVLNYLSRAKKQLFEDRLRY